MKWYDSGVPVKDRPVRIKEKSKVERIFFRDQPKCCPDM